MFRHVGSSIFLGKILAATLWAQDIKIWSGESAKLFGSSVRTCQEDRGRQVCDEGHLSLHNGISITHPEIPGEVSSALLFVSLLC